MTPFRPTARRPSPSSPRNLAQVPASARPTRALVPHHPDRPLSMVVLIVGPASHDLNQLLADLQRSLDSAQAGWMAVEVGTEADREVQLALLLEDAPRNHPQVLVIDLEPGAGGQTSGRRLVNQLLGLQGRWSGCLIQHLDGHDPALWTKAQAITSAWILAIEGGHRGRAPTAIGDGAGLVAPSLAPALPGVPDTEAYLATLHDWLQAPENRDRHQAHQSVHGLMGEVAAALLEMARFGARASLSFVHAGLRRVPPLPRIQLHELDLSGNPLTDLSGIPAGLEGLHLTHCRLSRLPLSPDQVGSLQVLALACNRFGGLPEILAHMPAGGQVDVRFNPVAQEHIEAYQVRMIMGIARLPSLLHSTPVPMEDSGSGGDDSTPEEGVDLDEPPPAEPVDFRLLEAVAASGSTGSPGDDRRAPGARIEAALRGWIDLRDEDREAAAWQRLEHADGADRFAGFIHRLRGTSRGAQKWAQPAMVQLLQAVLTDPALQEQVLAVVSDATQSCDDRVSLVWTQLKTLLRVHHIDSGELDRDLPALLGMARQVFRQDALQQAANAHVRRDRAQRAALGLDGRDAEDIEVYLAYAVNLHSPLGLDGPLPPARFVHQDISGVGLRDASRALKAIQQLENARFARFLADWKPWRQALKRLDAAAAQRIEDGVSDPAFAEDVAAEVKAAAQAAQVGTAYPNERDRVSAENQAIAAACNERIAKRWLGLTRQVLQDRSLDHLLDPAWALQAPQPAAPIRTPIPSPAGAPG